MLVFGFFGYFLWQWMQNVVVGGFVEDFCTGGVVAMYAEACAEGELERWRSALLFSQLRSVVAKAAGSENRADGVAARRLLIGRLNSPLLGMPVSIKKQWISLTETSSGLVRKENGVMSGAKVRFVGADSPMT